MSAAHPISALVDDGRHQHSVAQQPLRVGLARLGVSRRREEQRPRHRGAGTVGLVERRVQKRQQLRGAHTMCVEQM